MPSCFCVRPVYFELSLRTKQYTINNNHVTINHVMEQIEAGYLNFK